MGWKSTQYTSTTAITAPASFFYVSGCAGGSGGGGGDPTPGGGGGRRLRVRAVETLFDEDRLPHYKLMASRFEVEG